MPVIPLRAHLLQDRRSLYQLLRDCQSASVAKGRRQIVSLALEIPPIDPIAALQTLQLNQQQYFYLEKRHQGEAISAFEPLLQLQVEGPERFLQAQQFIQDCLANVINIGALDLPFAGLHFFCSFTFFDQNPVASPFAAATVFLPRWQVVRRQQQGLLVANLLVDGDTDLRTLVDQVWNKLSNLQTPESPYLQLVRGNGKPPRPQFIQGAATFTAAVEAILDSIRAAEFHKLVLAQVLDVPYPQPLDVLGALENLRDRYPDCYVFALGNGRGQTFMGASPERLIRMQNRELITDALAGSAPRGQTLFEDHSLAQRLLSSEKDLREHQVVIDFISQTLRHLGMVPQISPPPHLLQLPNIQHLRTLIKAEVPPHLHLLQILGELHPTPAVAGAPRAIACEQIRHYESFERLLYAAPLGWVDYQGNGEFVVGIRSALIDRGQTRLYAGAGIVAGSDPEKELAEVQLKLRALLEALSATPKTH